MESSCGYLPPPPGYPPPPPGQGPLTRGPPPYGPFPRLVFSESFACCSFLRPSSLSSLLILHAPKMVLRAGSSGFLGGGGTGSAVLAVEGGGVMGPGGACACKTPAPSRQVPARRIVLLCCIIFIFSARQVAGPAFWKIPREPTGSSRCRPILALMNRIRQCLPKAAQALV